MWEEENKHNIRLPKIGMFIKNLDATLPAGFGLCMADVRGSCLATFRTNMDETKENAVLRFTASLPRGVVAKPKEIRKLWSKANSEHILDEYYDLLRRSEYGRVYDELPEFEQSEMLLIPNSWSYNKKLLAITMWRHIYEHPGYVYKVVNASHYKQVRTPTGAFAAAWYYGWNSVHFQFKAVAYCKPQSIIYKEDAIRRDVTQVLQNKWKDTLSNVGLREVKKGIPVSINRNDPVAIRTGHAGLSTFMRRYYK
jgi:hypothetical protein